ncbi:hypothetical protein FQA39_LY16586 [Lamprigera yunnana]|nr:hypothetical protein FQA39_LY16586 [Lamprigera yunnana]
MLNDDGILVSDEAEESDQNTEEYNSQTNPHVDDETYSPSVSDAPSTPEGPTSGSRKKRKSKLNPVDERFLTFFEKKHESTAKREKSSNELFLANLLEDMNKLQQDDLRKIIMLRNLLSPITSLNIKHIGNMSSSPIDLIDYQGVKNLKPNETLLIDVREPKELKEAGTIPNSINIPLGEVETALKLDDAKFEEKYGHSKPSLDYPLVFSCLSGRRSESASQIAKKLGFQNIRSYKGGWSDWASHLTKE